ncbi:hypothetical protein [Ectobacillus funiculus]|uniref:Uncharacterized protein n=1 Tax=Ectobacillus funiculus TaxID=137993 RepID=A0ABV5WEA2_9BACI
MDASDDSYSYIETIEGVRLTVGSGSYRFKYPNQRGLRPTFSEETRVIDVLDYKEAVDILEKYAPGVTKPPRIFATKTQTLKELADFPEAGLSIDEVTALIEELNKIEWDLVLVES